VAPIEIIGITSAFSLRTRRAHGKSGAALD
jgi:hypothetical protein